MDEMMKCDQELSDKKCEDDNNEEKCNCVSRKVTENFNVRDFSETTEICSCYKGLQWFKVNGMFFIRVGYEICLKYVDCKGKKKSVRKGGSVLFFACPEMFNMRLSVHISPPEIQICEDEATAKFIVALCF